MKTKKCSKCEKRKSLSEFYKEKNSYDGLQKYCKNCQKEYQRKWNCQNKEKRRAYSWKWRRNNKEKHRAISNRWYKNNKKKKAKYLKKWRKENREAIRKYFRNYLQKPKQKIRMSISSRIYKALKGKKAGKHWEDLVGYTLKELKQRLECQFKEGMSWDNYGDWHIDHKKPLSSFSYEKSDEQAFKDCWALANLQPLWAEENFKKNNKY